MRNFRKGTVLILPTKNLGERRVLLTIGAAVLENLERPQSLSALWHRMRDDYVGAELTFDWFVLSLDLLYTVGAVDYRSGRLHKGSAT